MSPVRGTRWGRGHPEELWLSHTALKKKNKRLGIGNARSEQMVTGNGCLWEHKSPACLFLYLTLGVRGSGKNQEAEVLIWALAELGGGGFSWVSDSFPAPTFSLNLASTVFTVSKRV